MKKHILSIIAALASMTVTAQTTLTLEQCRQMAIDNNAAVKNAKLQSDMARATRQEAFTKYFPNVSAAGFAYTTNHGALQYDFNTDLPIPPLPIPGLESGGTLPIGVDFNLLKKGVMAGVNLVQPVFMGGMIVNGNRLAEVGEAVAELQSRQSIDQVRLTVEQYYWQLASLKAKRRTVDELLALLDTLQQQVNVAVEAGVTLRNDLLEVQLRRGEITTARLELDNGIAIMSSLLGQYIGKGLEPIDIAADSDMDAPVALSDGLYVDPLTAMTETADYGLLKQNVRAADLKKRMAVGENMPKIAVGAGYFYHDLLRQNHSFGSIYATVIVPISDWWGGSHAIKRARLAQQVAKNQLDDYSQLLQVKINNAWNDVSTALSKIEVANQSIAQANENLRLNELYYKVGTVTITDLLKAQTLYRQSHDQMVDAVGNYQVKTMEYLIATGR